MTVYGYNNLSHKLILLCGISTTFKVSTSTLSVRNGIALSFLFMSANLCGIKRTERFSVGTVKTSHLRGLTGTRLSVCLQHNSGSSFPYNSATSVPLYISFLKKSDLQHLLSSCRNNISYDVQGRIQDTRLIRQCQQRLQYRYIKTTQTTVHKRRSMKHFLKIVHGRDEKQEATCPISASAFH